jgi:leucyl aminopeptidase
MSERFTFAPNAEAAIPVTVLTPDTLAAYLDAIPNAQSAWVAAQDFKAAPGTYVVIPAPDGQIAAVLAAAPSAPPRCTRFDLARVAKALPAGTYRLDGALGGDDLAEAALGWLLSGYHFSQAVKPAPDFARLVAPDGVDAARIEAIAQGEGLTRDLINTPANQLGPDGIESAARTLAKRFGAKITVTCGDDLLAANLPLIHTVGRAADRAPRLIDMRHGDSGPTLTLVGKGVAFDTGGLNLKPGGSMGLMKKDMGGAATVLGLAQMILALQLPLRLRVLIPAVENSVAGNAFRPSDILTARNGMTVEINNTDAEGRLVLADALALATEEPTDLLISMATLTGAARVAVGPDLAPFYTDMDADAQALAEAADIARDPVWRMPFHPAYETMIEPGIADLDNAPSGGFAGSITAALFLRRFTKAARYMHFDIYGWQPTPAPARPKGGVGQGARALLEALPKMLDL